mgnify:CR=1 FL=1
MSEGIPAGVGIALLLAYLGFVLGMLLLMAVIAWKITARTGYSGALGLLYFVPLANIIFLLILAFSEWPIQREVKALRQQLAQSTGSRTPSR